MEHVDTTDVTPVLSMAFLGAIPPYALASLQWWPTDNYIVDPYSASETLQPHIT